MSLTKAERVAGRVFRKSQQACLSAMQPAAPCSPYIREYRHSCPKNNGISVAIAMREHYDTSPHYVIYPDGSVIETIGFALQAGPPGYVIVPPGLFAFIWLAGHCSSCHLAVRSSGRLVLAADRPPERRSGARQA